MVVQQETERDTAQLEAGRTMRRERAHLRGARNIRLKRACVDAMRLLWPGIALASVCPTCGTRMELFFEENAAPLPVIRHWQTEAGGLTFLYSGDRYWGCPECGKGEWERYRFTSNADLR